MRRIPKKEVFSKDDEYYYNYVRSNLKKIREDKGISQKKLSKLSGVSNTYISDIENIELNRHPSISKIGLLADALGVTITSLITDDIRENNIIHHKNYYNEVIRKNIIKYRELNNLTQEDLADMVGLTRQYICDIETNNHDEHASLALVGRISDALDVDITKLFEE